MLGLLRLEGMMEVCKILMAVGKANGAILLPQRMQVGAGAAGGIRGEGQQRETELTDHPKLHLLLLWETEHWTRWALCWRGPVSYFTCC